MVSYFTEIAMRETRIAYLMQRGLSRKEAEKLAEQNDRRERQAVDAARLPGDPRWKKNLPPVATQPADSPAQKRLF